MLAIGIVVDDAIVVVENVERNIENGLSPHNATIRAMSEVTSPIIAITLVLCAVFVPIAFISGLTGEFYRQFALTIAISTVISAFNSLTLSPALAAVLLRGHDAPQDRLTRFLNLLFGWFFRIFNRGFRGAGRLYGKGVGGIVQWKVVAVLFYLLLLGGTYFAFQAVPPGFVPVQDKQYLVSFAQLPDGATLDRTEAVIRRMSDIALKEPGVDSAVAFPGLSINGFINSASAGIVFVTLKPFEERTTPNLSGFAIAHDLQMKYGAVNDAFIAIFPPPPVQGLGTIGGFKLQVEDRTDLGYEALDSAMKAIEGKAMQAPQLGGVFSSYKINEPQLNAELDRTKAMQLGVDVQDVYDSMQIYLGSYYINDFNKFGRTYQVIAQADKAFRSRPEDILQLKTRSADGQMVPFGSIMTVSDTTGPESTMHYNSFRSADLNGAAAPGYSSGQAQAAMDTILKQTLPKGMDYEWTDLDLPANPRRRHRLARFPRLRAACLPRAGGEIRKSLRAVRSRAHRADVPALGHLRRLAFKGRQQRLYPNWPLRAGRSRLQERDPHRRICTRLGVGRRGHGARCHSRRRPPPAAHPDDLLRFHHGRHSAGALRGVPEPRCDTRWAWLFSPACSASPSSALS